MASEAFKEKVSGFVREHKVTIAGLFASVALTMAVSAGNLTDALSPIISDVTALFPLILALILAAIPVIIAMLIIDFFTGLFGGILGKLKM